MEASNELLMQAVYENDLKIISCYLSRGININKICSNGMTLLGAAAQTGNITVLKTLIENHSSLQNLDFCNENICKPQYLQLDTVGHKKYKNIGYFVVCSDSEENEFGDGPTPDGMEALEWDMEVNETHFPTEDNDSDEQDLNMYKWYANILNRTSLLLESPERDVARLDRHGQSVLHYAVNSGNIDMVDYLISMLGKEFNINQNDSSCFSPLHMASANGDVEMVKWLLKKGANVNVVGGRHRQFPLHVAARAAHVEVMKILIDAGKGYFNRGISSTLISALELLKQPGLQNTTLHTNKVGLIKAESKMTMILQGADINAVDIEERSVLTLATRQGSIDSINLLLKSNVRVNHEEPGGVTALRLAVWATNSPLVQILLEGGARIVHSHYLLHTAVSNNSLEVVQLLVEAGAMVNAQNDQGHTPLMLACSRKNLALARYLLTHGVDVNASSNIDSKTALHICVQDVREAKCVHQLIELLVRYGADMNATSYQGSVLFFSIILENRSAATALVQHGADVNLRDDRAYVDNLSLAKRHGDLDLVKLLVYAGFRLEEMTWDPRALRTQSLDLACDFLINVKTNPLSLRDICRIVIRKKLGMKNLVTKIFALPLPTLLQKYLTLEIL